MQAPSTTASDFDSCRTVVGFPCSTASLSAALEVLSEIGGGMPSGGMPSPKRYPASWVLPGLLQVKLHVKRGRK